jgi:hypothetical protein
MVTAHIDEAATITLHMWEVLLGRHIVHLPAPPSDLSLRARLLSETAVWRLLTTSSP